MENYIAGAIAGVKGLADDGGVLALKESGVWLDATAKPEYKSYEKKGFNTPSSKWEVRSDRLSERGFLPLPTYQPIPEGGDGELHLITFQFNVHTYSRTGNLMWLAEIVHDNPVWINPETARGLGIRKGDKVRLVSKIGSIVAKAWLTHSVPPQVVAMGACVGHWETGRVAKAQKFKSNNPSTQLVWWDKEGNGVHPYHIIPAVSDPVGGGQAWMDSRVRIERVG
ncbi:MAG TPA: molybdopterin dinucleotide binding domain-containing protein [Thermoleophilia bacterium]|nr:molybdopterin dinucleotide binding domain-containing protein [Thermoleophilia bacterium]